MEVLAIIPARGGSKGLPGKNILPLNGHPLIAYSIAAGLQTPEISRVICSTDSKEIAKVAINYGAEIPFMRPSDIAQDHSSDLEVFDHALEWLWKNESYKPDYIVQLRPTSPIRFISDIQVAINYLISDSEIDSVRTVSEPVTTPYKMWTLDKNGYLTPLLALAGVPEPYNTARQELPEIWAQTGTLEVIRTSTVTKKRSMTGDNIFALKIDSETYVDIDTFNSFLLAEYVINKIDCIKPSL
jgi:CMP-N,N'-diacetyllegionaminic acid synthase